MRRPGDRFLAWAERWLDETIVRDVVAPTVADLQHEHRLARDDEQRRALRRHGWLVLGRTLAGSLGLGVGRSGSAPWWVLLAPLFVLMFSAHTLVVIEPSKAGRHMMFSGLGLVMAIAIVAAPARLARLQGVIAALVACGLTAVSLDGTMHLGVRRWLEIGPLTVHLAALVTPLYVGVLLGWAPSRRRFRTAFMFVCAVTLVLQSHLAMAVLWGAVTVAAVEDGERRTAQLLWATAVGLCVVLAPASTPLLGMGETTAVTGTGTPLWATLVSLGLFVPAAFAWRRSGRTEGTARRHAYAFAVLFGVWPMLALMAEGLVLLSYGGSMVVAYLACVALMIRDTRCHTLA